MIDNGFGIVNYLVPGIPDSYTEIELFTTEEQQIPKQAHPIKDLSANCTPRSRETETQKLSILVVFAPLCVGPACRAVYFASVGIQNFAVDDTELSDNDTIVITVIDALNYCQQASYKPVSISTGTQ